MERQTKDWTPAPVLKPFKNYVYRTKDQAIFLLHSFYSRIVFIPKADITVNSGDTAVPTAYQNATAIRFLRINPRSWYKESALRVEIYGCVLPKISTEGMGVIVLTMQKTRKIGLSLDRCIEQKAVLTNQWRLWRKPWFCWTRRP